MPTTRFKCSRRVATSQPIQMPRSASCSADAANQPPTLQRAVFRTDQIAHLRAHQRPGALRVFTKPHLIPHTHLISRLYPDQPQSPHIPRLCGYLPGSLKTPRLLGNHDTSVARSKQYKMTGSFHLLKRLHAATRLRYPARIQKAELRAHRMGKRRASSMGIATEQMTDRFN